MEHVVKSFGGVHGVGERVDGCGEHGGLEEKEIAWLGIAEALPGTACIAMILYAACFEIFNMDLIFQILMPSKWEAKNVY